MPRIWKFAQRGDLHVTAIQSRLKCAVFSRLVAALFGVVMVAVWADGARADALDQLTGRWVGQGRLGLKDSPPEIVKCRATYIRMKDGAHGLRQTIRCATAGAKIEVKSELHENNGQLHGKWVETIHNVSGDLIGEVTDKGLRIKVRGGDITANMEVLVREDRQMVEIQFFESSLIGLTLMLTKG